MDSKKRSFADLTTDDEEKNNNIMPKYYFPSKVYLVVLDNEPNSEERAHSDNMRWTGTELEPSNHMDRTILKIFYKKEDAIEYTVEYAKNALGFDVEEEYGDDDDSDNDSFMDRFWFNGEGYLKEDEESNLINDIRLHIMVEDVE